jgi:hypothetical protein
MHTQRVLAAVVALVVLASLATGCKGGPGDDTTTTGGPPAPPSGAGSLQVTLPPANPGSTGSTAAGSGAGTGSGATVGSGAADTGATIGSGATPVAAGDAAYAATMKEWMQQYLFGMDTSALAIADPTAATSEQVAAAERFAADVRGAVAKLQSVTPPPELRDVHQEFVASMVQLTQAIDAYVAAVETGKQAQVEAALPAFATAQARVQAATNMLAPNVGVQVPDSAGI